MAVIRSSADAPEVVEKVAKEFNVKAKVRVNLSCPKNMRRFSDLAWLSS